MSRQRGYYDPGKKPFPQNYGKVSAPRPSARTMEPAALDFLRPAELRRLERAEAKRRRKGKR